MQPLLARNRAGLHCSQSWGAEDAVSSCRRLYSSCATLLRIIRYHRDIYTDCCLYSNLVYVSHTILK